MQQLAADDRDLLRIIDAALADAARRSGPWLTCHPGCNQCCTGVFAISEQDTARLQLGLAQLAVADRSRHSAILSRAAASADRLRPSFPGDKLTGILGTTDLDEERFESFANSEVCPVLDPITGLCDLYDHRPLTCRTFGPPVRTDEGALGVCELCFVNAPEQAVAAAEMHLPSTLDETGNRTIVTFALLPHEAMSEIIDLCPPQPLP